MGQLPKRGLTHEIDSETCKIVDRSFEKSWEIRELTGHDFGIDKIVEYFDDGVSTGNMLLLQIKGTKDIIDEEKPHFQMPVKTLLYSELFTTPFILIYGSLENQVCYYLWLQEYIKVILNYDKPNWKKQETVNVHFPKTNKLSQPNAQQHLLYIAQLPTQKDNWIDFYLSLDGFEYELESLCEYYSNDFFDDEVTLKEKKKHFFITIESIERRIKKSYKIFQKFSFINFTNENFNDLLNLVKKIKQSKTLPTNYEFEHLIAYCKLIHSHVIGISQHYSTSFSRVLYEIDKSTKF